MPLTGTFERNLDDKLRLALPKPVRDELTKDGGMVYVVPEPDGAVGIYAAAAFQIRADKLSQSSGNPNDVRKFMRILYSQAENVSADGQGRVRIPERLASRSGLSGEVVVLGVGDHLEVWTKTAWDASLEQLQSEFDELANIAFQPSPTT